MGRERVAPDNPTTVLRCQAPGLEPALGEQPALSHICCTQLVDSGSILCKSDGMEPDARQQAVPCG